MVLADPRTTDGATQAPEPSRKGSRFAEPVFGPAPESAHDLSRSGSRSFPNLITQRSRNVSRLPLQKLTLRRANP